MLQVWKFPLAIADSQQIEMPHGCKILHFAVQNDQPCIWALVDPDAEKGRVSFRLAGTGHPIEHEMDKLEFIGTILIRNGSLVFHLFKIK